MQIDRKSFPYKFWASTYGVPFERRYPPHTTSLCQFFWRNVYGALLYWPFWIVAMAIVGMIMTVVGLFTGFFGFRPTICEGDPQDCSFVPYRSPVRIKQYSFYPWHLLAIGLLWLGIMHWHGVGLVALWILGIAAIIALIVGLCIGVKRVIQSDSLRLVREYIKAKKAKVCPLIEFVDTTPPRTVDNPIQGPHGMSA